MDVLCFNSSSEDIPKTNSGHGLPLPSCGKVIPKTVHRHNLPPPFCGKKSFVTQSKRSIAEISRKVANENYVLTSDCTSKN